LHLGNTTLVIGHEMADCCRVKFETPTPAASMMTMLLTDTCLRAGIFTLFLSVITMAQGGPPPAATPTPPAGAERAGADSDPTRPVVWSLREEYYNLRGPAWSNAFLFRVDRAILKDRFPMAGNRGILTRLDIPFVLAHGTDGTSAGLGDIYVQALLVRQFTKFAFAAGSGVSIPTATDHRLGTGKLTLAPLAVPVWLIPKRGIFFVKVQDYISVAGAGDRADLHYLTVTPLLVWRLQGKPYWIQLDGETKTNWKANEHTGAKVGFLFGRITKKRGVWIKAEVGLGPYREAAFAIKTSIFKVR